MLEIKAELLLDSRAKLGEGMTLLSDGAMCFVDIEAGRAFQIRAGELTNFLSYPHPISKVLPWDRGYLVLGKAEIIGLDFLGNEITRYPLPMLGANQRCSDGAVMPNGDLVFGVLDMDLAPGCGLLLHLSKSGEISMLLDNLDIPNGIAVSEVQRLVHWIDSPTGELIAFDWNAELGRPRSPKVFATIDKSLGTPDGMATDSAGGIWLAMWSGSKVVRVNQQGEIDLIVKVGCENVTSCGFDEQSNLLITTASVATETQDPGAGGVWIVPQQVHGFFGAKTFVAGLAASPLEYQV